ncbi:predicted protein [Postia placenta Mad-698-R]|uniref:F-box domain-containing protein n=1 Tax=Postia placenta MAD-698-R-SB12 TaxID=670580 RepID=A0A1X6MYE5_9APHY|nr:hypothetical protein POSPLADRAFT_1034075 [Postia placenta MAD-698-R-SB12]EED83365.1 predicted protein [Postia placenta Mad-698-R]OSX61384.1 hypothetical protein POSPLADRAFT_1034075 [Postia placenta MAD-698-R-SB12]
MATERALAIPEIVSHIFCQFTFRPPNEARWRHNKTLARSARVSKSFMGPALDALWNHLDWLHPLLRLLSACKLVLFTDEELRGLMPFVHPMLEPKHVWIFDGDICALEWERFETYARRVRSMSLELDGSVGPSVFAALARHNGRRPLFPLLRELSWMQWMPAFDGTHQMLASPHLRELHIDILVYPERKTQQESLDIRLKRLLEEFSRISPNIKKVYLNGGFRRCPSVGGFKYLRCLQVSAETSCIVNDASLKSLSGLEDLAELSLSTATTLRIPPISQGFVALTSLCLVFCNKPAMLFLFTTTFPRLRSIAISYRPRFFMKLDGCRKFIEDIARACARLPSLRKLCIEFDFDDGFGRAPPFLDIVRPLLSLTALEDVEISDLREVAQAWPRLTRFSLAISALDYPLLPTVDCLVSFARACPSLKQLVLPSMAHSLPRARDMIMVPAIPAHGLQSLEFMTRPKVLVDLDVDFAHCLNRLFPKVSLSCSAVDFERQYFADGHMAPSVLKWDTLVHEVARLQSTSRRDTQQGTNDPDDDPEYGCLQTGCIGDVEQQR